MTKVHSSEVITNKATLEPWSQSGRARCIEQLHQQDKQYQWDMIIIGGGITGAGILREAKRRGVKALLVEQRDFAWGTSSRSSKMVHGGLRYLGAGQPRLTLESVRERQLLLEQAPGLVKPLNYLLAHYKNTFPGPFIFNILLTVYDWMAGIRDHGYINKDLKDFHVPGINTCDLKGASQFFDAITDDARLVLRVLQESISDDCMALNYVSADSVLKDEHRVTGLRLVDGMTSSVFDVHAKVVVNATGAWSDQLREKLGQKSVIRPLRGSHLVVPGWRLPVAYSMSVFHPDDKRPVFIFPWEGVTVIGTTDLDHEQDLQQEACITQAEVDYLLGAVDRQFPAAKIGEEDIVSTFSGVRPVVAGGSLTPSREKREHTLLDDQGMISVAGGKLTTFRVIAQDVFKACSKYLWSQSIEGDDKEVFISTKTLLKTHKDSPLSSAQFKRLVGRYGHLATELINLSREGELNTIAGTDFLYAELRWAVKSEMVLRLDDLLLRRTRLGLLMKSGAQELLDWIKPLFQEYLRWSDSTWEEDVARYMTLIDRYYSLPKRHHEQ